VVLGQCLLTVILDGDRFSVIGFTVAIRITRACRESAGLICEGTNNNM